MRVYAYIYGMRASKLAWVGEAMAMCLHAMAGSLGFCSCHHMAFCIAWGGFIIWVWFLCTSARSWNIMREGMRWCALLIYVMVVISCQVVVSGEAVVRFVMAAEQCEVSSHGDSHMRLISRCLCAAAIPSTRRWHAWQFVIWLLL